MKRLSRILTLFILPVLALSACSGLPLTISFNRPITPVVAVAPADTSVAAAAPAATNTLPPTTAPAPTDLPATAAPASEPAIQPAASINTSTSQILQVPGNVLDFQTALEAVYQKVNPSVVSIQVTEEATATFGRRRFQNLGPQIALGSGFVWDSQGHIVTNNHVVSGATAITVTFADGTTVDATLVGADPNSDLAVIKVNLPASQLVPVEVADFDPGEGR